MNLQQNERRNFLKTAGAATGGILLGVPAIKSIAVATPTSTPPQIETPFHGAVLNHRHGKKVAGGMLVRVVGQADAGEKVTVNGLLARRKGRAFEADVVLRKKETPIVAVAGNASEQAKKHEIRVIWDRYSRPRYRFSIDDNSFFLRDIARKKPKSLFDCFYLKILQDLNKSFGAKFTLNIYYTTGDGFSLPDFPDRYKGQWRDNSDWLTLAFHARADKPDRPYQDAPPEKLIADLDQVSEQILRFAGEETLSMPTVIHWAMTRPSAWRPLYERGVRVLSGYFRPHGNSYDINYRMDNDRSAYLWKHDALMDFDSGIVFSRVDIICNATPVDKIVPTLEPLTNDPNTAEIMDIFTHEQYFWPFYQNYLPDHARRLDTAIRYVTEQGYEPIFFHEGFLGGKEPV
ncbi:MAG: twin-arginine translocation signal domain-containing protein [Pirellulales bacterium]|nr:twin-arginine translocation signal domain-containing protein [Pirellulales bacterium]